MLAGIQLREPKRAGEPAGRHLREQSTALRGELLESALACLLTATGVESLERNCSAYCYALMYVIGFNIKVKRRIVLQ